MTANALYVVRYTAARLGVTVLSRSETESSNGHQRVAEYRARRKAEKLCVEAGCGRRVRKYVRYDEHRRAHNESAAKIRFKAFEADLARDDVDATHRDLISTEELAGLVCRAAEVDRLSAEN